MPFESDSSASRCYAVGVISFSVAGLILSYCADEQELNNHLQLPIYVSTLFIRIASVIGVIEGVFVLCTVGRADDTLVNQGARLWPVAHSGVAEATSVSYESWQDMAV